MLSVTDVYDGTSIPVRVRSSNSIVYVHSDPAGSIHCTDVDGINEASFRFLDKITRQTFVDIVPQPGTVNIIEAPAGSGKTTMNIKTLINYTQKTGKKSNLLAFNTAAVNDATVKINGADGVHTSTIDAMIWKLFKPTQEMTELSDALSVSKMANSLMDEPVYQEQVEDMIDDLIYACDSGDDSTLYGDAEILYTKGMNGEWWCYPLLRLRALQQVQAWQALFNDYGLIIVDEAQDIGPIIMKLLKLLHEQHAMVYTLDPSQKIYSFLGCVNVLEEIDEFTHWRLHLTFRHGQSVCDYIYHEKISDRRVFSGSADRVTTIQQINDDTDIPEQHTLIVTSWRNCIAAADTLLNNGKTVCIDPVKHKDLLGMASNSGWTKENGKLFKFVPKHFVRDCMERINTVPPEKCDVFITTIHGAKGLEYGRVRISKCVLTKRGGNSADETDDHLSKVYVALTRVIYALYLPIMKRKRS